MSRRNPAASSRLRMTWSHHPSTADHQDLDILRYSNEHLGSFLQRNPSSQNTIVLNIVSEIQICTYAHLSRICNSFAKGFITVSKCHSSDIPRLKSCGILAIMTGVRNVPYVSDDTPIPCKRRVAASVLSKSCRSCFKSRNYSVLATASTFQCVLK